MSEQKQSLNQMLDDAKLEINRISAEEALTLTDSDDHVWIDIRDVRELWRDGTIPCAEHAPRGMLEWWVDPESSYHREVFAKDKHYVLF